MGISRRQGLKQISLATHVIEFLPQLHQGHRLPFLDA